jgi:hypothetical protein
MRYPAKARLASGFSQSGRGRKPDLTVYLAGSCLPARDLIRVPPDIEIVSSTPRDGRRDRGGKTADYAAFGVAWYGACCLFKTRRFAAGERPPRRG